jgi:CubicO group peptidase (beta-lactamase class C family)
MTGKSMKWCHSFTFTISILIVSLASSIEASIETVLDKIADRACGSQSDVVLIAHRGNIIGVYGSQRTLEPIDTRSVTKTFVSLAIGFLMQEGKISTLDMPVYYFFPEWRQGYKQDVTIRHLMNHTSGLRDEECFAEFPDIVRLALSSDIVDYPGTQFNYNNNCLNLLAGIVKRASGENVDEFLKRRLFDPLGISSVTWLSDATGNCFGMSHLTINALDLAKVGMMIARQGCWNGKKILSQEWIEFMKSPNPRLNPFYGPLCWQGFDSLDICWDPTWIQHYEEAGISSAYIRCLKATQGYLFSLQGHINFGDFNQRLAEELHPYFGSSFQSVYRFLSQVEQCRLPFPIARWGYLRTISARGHSGQQLIILPDDDLVAVRLSNHSGMEYGNPDTFPDLESLLVELSWEFAHYYSLKDACGCRPY